VYWAITVLTTTGYGDISPVSDAEMGFNLIVFIVGTLIYALVIADLEEIVSQLDVTVDMFKGKIDRLQSFLKREGVRTSIDTLSDGASSSTSTVTFEKKVSIYFQKLWLFQRGAEHEEVVRYLPPNLQKDLFHRATLRDLSHLFYVSSKSAEFQRNFLSILSVHHYLAGEYIFRTGQTADKLFLVFRGTLRTG
jgi:hypothetical protein